MLTESGDMGPAVFHAVTADSGSATVNVTPLTEAHAALTLGATPSMAYGTSSAMQQVTPTRLAQANTTLLSALANVADFSANPNFVSDPLDATPGAANTGNARKHDATLDQLSVSVSFWLTEIRMNLISGAALVLKFRRLHAHLRPQLVQFLQKQFL
jgi:hypothetical protein